MMFVLRSVARLALFGTFAYLSTAPALADMAAPADCWQPDELSAARVGDLQSTLMVLALKCQETSATTLAAYNKFMADKHDVVLRDKYLIQAHFVRHLGPSEGLKASAAYDTRLGNQNSSPVVTVAKCEQAGAYARIAASAGESDLPVLAGMVGATSALPACPVAVAVAASPAAMVIPVWTRPVAPAGPAGAPAPANAAPVTVAPAAAPAVAVQPKPAVAVVAPGAAPQHAAAAPASNADAVKALQAAVAALSQVAASLQPPAAVSPASPAPAVDTED